MKSNPSITTSTGNPAAGSTLKSLSDIPRRETADCGRGEDVKEDHSACTSDASPPAQENNSSANGVQTDAQTVSAQTPEVAAELRRLDRLRRGQEHSHTQRHHNFIEWTKANMPYCALCGRELTFQAVINGHIQSKHQAIQHRFYRNVPKPAKRRLQGLRTSVCLCFECERDINQIYQTRRVQILRERDGAPIAGGQ